MCLCTRQEQKFKMNFCWFGPFDHAALTWVGIRGVESGYDIAICGHSQRSQPTKSGNIEWANQMLVNRFI